MTLSTTTAAQWRQAALWRTAFVERLAAAEELVAEAIAGAPVSLERVQADRAIKLLSKARATAETARNASARRAQELDR